MKILYGVQGTGNGHISRARIMAKYFANRRDVSVDFVFSGRDACQYFDMEVFADYRTFAGVSFTVIDGEVNVLATLRHNRVFQLFSDIKQLDLSGYDLVLNDFEPITAWAAKRQGIPSISISHQASFYHPIPKTDENYIDRLLLKYFAPCQVNLGVHWHHFGHSIIPPFIEESPIAEPKGGFYLIYLPFENRELISAMLEPISEHQFICYHPDVESEEQLANVLWRKPSKQTFREALQNCDGVIANAGFELSSECLKLGKALLLKPLTGQFEQASNVLTLKHMGLCTELKALSADELEVWLQLEQSPKASVVYPADPTPLIDWIVKGDWHNTEQICQALWQQVGFPEQVKLRLARL